MSDDKKQEEAPFIDPNSGASMQPGAFVVSEQPGEGPALDSDADPVLAHTTETQAAPAGPQPGDEDAPDASESGGEDDPGNADASAGEEKDYSELLSGTVAEVQAYLEQYPDEKDAVVKAEQSGQGRKGIVES